MSIVKIYLFCIIILIGLLDVGLNLISVIPGAGDVLETMSEGILETIQAISAGIITFSRFVIKDAKEHKDALSGFMRICMFCAFILMGVLDVGGNLLSLIPGVGDIAETLTEAILELIQIALAGALLLF